MALFHPLQPFIRLTVNSYPHAFFGARRRSSLSLSGLRFLLAFGLVRFGFRCIGIVLTLTIYRYRRVLVLVFDGVVATAEALTSL